MTITDPSPRMYKSRLATLERELLKATDREDFAIALDNYRDYLRQYRVWAKGKSERYAYHMPNRIIQAIKSYKGA